MIITLKGADFSASNIGTLSSWRISRSLGAGATYEGPTSVDKGASFSATVTLAEGYEIGTAGVTVTMGGTVLSGAHSISGNVITITIASVTGNVLIKVPTINTATGEEEEPEVPDTPVVPDDGENTELTLYQGYATGTQLDNSLNTRVRTDFIEGAFSIALNEGYVIRAIYEFTSPSVKNGTELVASSQNLTSYTKSTTSGYSIVTICKTNASSTIAPTENIVKSFTGKIYEIVDYITVNGVKIKMGQILGTGLKEHTGRAYTVTPLNDKTTISTSGSNFVMIPLYDTDSDVTTGNPVTLYTASDGTFNNSNNGSLQYHNTIAIADIKAAAPDGAYTFVMFKHSTATSFNLEDLTSAVKIS